MRVRDAPAAGFTGETHSRRGCGWTTSWRSWPRSASGAASSSRRSEIYGGINACWDYGPLGVAAEEQRQARLVDGDDPDARRHRGARRRHPDAPARLGGLRATSRTSPTRWSTARSARRASAPTSSTSIRPHPNAAHAPAAATAARLTEPRLFNLMFKTFMGPVEDDGLGRLPAPRDGPGDLRQLRQRARRRRARRSPSASPRSARPSATRSPRATSSSARASSSRWRCSSSSSRATDDGVVRALEGRSACSGTRRPRHPRRRSSASTSTARTSWPTTPRPPSTSSTSSRFGWQELEGIHNRSDFDLRRHQEFSGKKLEYFDEASQGALPPLHHRDLGRLRPHAPDLPRRRLPRGRVRRARRASSSRFHPLLAPIKAAVFPLVKKDGMPEIAHRIVDRAARRTSTSSTTRAAPIGRRYRAHGRGRHAVLHHGRRPDADRTQSVTVRDRDTLRRSAARSTSCGCG